jgi:hypothetical protein
MQQHKIGAALSKLFGRYASAVRSTLTVYLFSFVGLFGASLIGWVTQVADWASKHGADPFPSTSVLGYAFVAALTSGAPALVAGLVRSVQTATGTGNVPTYQGTTPPVDTYVPQHTAPDTPPVAPPGLEQPLGHDMSVAPPAH